ncbi:MAG: ABC transporter permease [Phycisphaerae bacterium]|nr:ABC transporter permease [Phycisphaerae bacterium]
MRTLDRMLLRDLWRLKWPLAAIALVIAAGVAALVMARSTASSLRACRDDYYRAYRFADVFVSLKRAPDALADRLADIPGVASVQTRIVHEVNLSVPGVAEPAAARIVSLHDGPGPGLNGLHLRRGRLPEPGSDREAVVSEAFALANGLRPGDEIGAVINGAWQRLSIVGVGLSPEFVYFIRAGELLPDNRRSGVLWMRRAAIADALNMHGAFNDAAIALLPGASAPAVIRAADDLLARHGSFGAYDRTDHPSDRYLRDEFDQLAVMGTLTPAIFLSVGAFLVNVVLGRQVRTQREQFATIRAFGYSNRALARHVGLLALTLAFAAAALGIAVGWWLGRDLASFYVEVFRFPHLAFSLDPAAATLGSAVACAAALLGALGALRWVVRLAPAEAMRPESPGAFRPTILERCGLRRLPVRWRLVVRALEQHPWRAALGVLGIACSAAVLVLSNFALDAIDHMIDRQYSATQRYDLSVAFNEPVSDSALHSLRAALADNAVLRAEPLRSAPARVSNGQHARRLAILGLDPGDQLLRLYDADDRPIDLPPDGLLISRNLAEALRAAPGSPLHIEFLDGGRRTVDVPVAGIFSGAVGLAAYMQRDALARLTADAPVMSGVLLRQDQAAAAELFDRLKSTPAVASVTSKLGALESFRRTIADNITRITLLHAAFAAVIAFGVVYNTARIAFAERRRELATLRVLGFSRTEVGAMLQGEIVVMTIAAIPIGLAIGHALAWWLVEALRTESYEFPLVILPRTYAFAALITAGATACSAWVVRRGVARLDLLSTLKEAG